LLILYYSDRAGRSIPAPGRGALTVATEVPSKYPLPILDVAYRSRQLTFRRSQISQWLMYEHSQLREETDFRKSQGEAVDDEYFSSHVADIENEAKRQEEDAIVMYRMLEGADARISPLCRALAVWGLAMTSVYCLFTEQVLTPTTVPYVKVLIFAMEYHASQYYVHIFISVNLLCCRNEAATQIDYP